MINYYNFTLSPEAYAKRYGQGTQKGALKEAYDKQRAVEQKRNVATVMTRGKKQMNEKEANKHGFSKIDYMKDAMAYHQFFSGPFDNLDKKGNFVKPSKKTMSQESWLKQFMTDTGDKIGMGWDKVQDLGDVVQKGTDKISDFIDRPGVKNAAKSVKGTATKFAPGAMAFLKKHF